MSENMCGIYNEGFRDAEFLTMESMTNGGIVNAASPTRIDVH